MMIVPQFKVRIVLIAELSEVWALQPTKHKHLNVCQLTCVIIIGAVLDCADSVESCLTLTESIARLT